MLNTHYFEGYTTHLSFAELRLNDCRLGNQCITSLLHFVTTLEVLSFAFDDIQSFFKITAQLIVS